MKIYKFLTYRKSVLYIAIFIAAILSLSVVFFSRFMYRDAAAVYAYMSRALWNGNYAEAFHPNIPSLNVLLSWLLSWSGLSPEQALTAVSCIFYIFTIPFLYRLLICFTSERLAAIGCLLFATAPKIIRFFCTSIIDSGKIFFLVMGLYYGYLLIKEEFKSWRLGLLFGISLGGLSLARSEGIGNAAVLCACLGVYYIMTVMKTRRISQIQSWIAILSAWGILLLSRMLVIWLNCGSFIYDQRISRGIQGLMHRTTDQGVNATETVARVSWGHLMNQMLRGSYELYFVLIVTGILLCCFPSNRFWFNKKSPEFIRWNPFYWVLIIVVLSNALIFKLSDIAAYRYFLLNIPVLMIFIVIGLDWCWQWMSKWFSPVILYSAFGVMIFFQILNGMERFFSEEAKQEYTAGLELREMLKNENPPPRIWFRDASAEWYYSGLPRAVAIETPPKPANTFSEFDYALMYSDEKDMEILCQRQDLQEIPLSDNHTLRLFKKVK